MSKQQRLIQPSLIGALLLGLLGLLAFVLFAAKKHPAKPKADGNDGVHRVEKRPDEVRKYWTAEKMRAAKPAPMPQTDDLKPGKEHQSHS